MTNHTEPPEVIDLTEPVDFGQRFLLSLVALGIAAILCLCARAFDPTDSEQSANRIYFWLMAGMLAIAAPCTPFHSAKQLDLGRCELTETLTRSLQCRRPARSPSSSPRHRPNARL